MCRLVGIVASERTDFRFSLHEAPRSLAALSREHPHGWGIAVYEEREGWSLQKGVECAGEDEQFHDVAAESHGELLVAHVRFRTVGATRIENTHPFRRGRWVFAHNGTIEDLAYLRERTSPARRAEIAGDTDSELFFAHLLTRLDAAGLADAPAGDATDAVIAAAAREARERPGFGAVNFVLSDGDVLYAHRFGRTLFLLERSPWDTVRAVRESHETGAVIETPWTSRRRAVLVASEQLTDEPWKPVPEGALLRLDRAPSPWWRAL